MRTIVRSVDKIRLLSLCVLLWVACKKDNPPPPGEEEIVTPKYGSRKEMSLDSIYLYAKHCYYWNEALPSYRDFDPRAQFAGVSPEETALSKSLYRLSQFSMHPGGKPYEWTRMEGRAKYSFLEVRAQGSAGAKRLASIINTSASMHLESNSDIGYLRLHSFPRLAAVQGDLDRAFAAMASQNISTLIIDLRFNGGGYIETAGYVADLIAPMDLEGKIKYTEHFNTLMQHGRASMLKQQAYLDKDGKTMTYKGRLATMADIDFSVAANTKKFQKKGDLHSIKRLYFISNSMTASASELLISCFKPYLSIRLVGERTYGKPVGSFAIRIDRYNLYLATLQLRNANGWGDYFDGIPPDIEVFPGTTDYQVGSPQDPFLQAVYKDLGLEFVGLGNSGLGKDFKRTTAKTLDRSSIAAGKAEALMIKEEFKLKD